LKENLDQETKARIIGCKSQMESFYFFFGLNLSYKLYAMTDNLSRALQSSRMPAIKGKKCADLVVSTLSGMRNDEDFNSFYEVTSSSSNLVNPLGEPTLPGNPFFNTSPVTKDLRIMLTIQKLRKIISNLMYYQALDAIVNAINDRFEQPGLIKFTNVEQLLLKSIVKGDTSNELEVLKADFDGYFDPSQIDSELLLLPTVFHQSSPVDFRDIFDHLQGIEIEKRQMLKNIWKIIRIVLTSGATSATPERSFVLILFLS